MSDHFRIDGESPSRLTLASLSTADPLTFQLKTGLAAVRHPLKVLNHLGTAATHNSIALSLGLHHEAVPNVWYRQNRSLFDICAAHSSSLVQLGSPPPSRFAQFDIEHIIRNLVHNASFYGHQSLTCDEVRRRLRSARCAAQVEFHPCDICNERCKGCTYGHDDPTRRPPPICYPFADLPRIAAFEPRAIVIAGGGEPQLYRDPKSGKVFPDLVRELRRLLPTCQFALITNGTRYGAADWWNEFRWVRFSIDAATAAMYHSFRRRPYFDRVCENLLGVLTRTKVPQVNAGFVFCRENVLQAPHFAKHFYDLARQACPEALHRLFIDYRPLRRDPKDAGREFPEYVTNDQIRQVEEMFQKESDLSFRAFLQSNSNWSTILKGNTHDKAPFGRCGFSSIYRLVRASGELRPCCMRLAEPEFRLGNVLSDPSESIGLRSLVNAGYLLPGCDADGCKLAKVNHILDEGLAGTLAPSQEPAIANNPFFG